MASRTTELGVSPAHYWTLQCHMDDAEELLRLARLSHPRVTVDTTGLSPRATELANRLAASISRLCERDLERLSLILESDSDMLPIKE